MHCNTLQHSVAHCIILQHTATHCNTLQHTHVSWPFPTPSMPNTFQVHCNTLQHAATHCNTLQHTVSHCNKLQHTATHCGATALSVSTPFQVRNAQTNHETCENCNSVCLNIYISLSLSRFLSLSLAFCLFLPSLSLLLSLSLFLYLSFWLSILISNLKRFEQIELPAKLLDYFLSSNKSNINQYKFTLSYIIYIC